MGAEKVLLNSRPAPRRSHEAAPLAAAGLLRLGEVGGVAALRLALRMRSDRLGVLQSLSGKGDVVTVKAGWKRLIFVFDPEIARGLLMREEDAFVKGLGLDDARVLFGNGLLTSGGETWRTERGHMAALFAASYLPAALGATLRAVDAELAGGSMNSDSCLLAGFVSRVALKALGEAAFGRRIPDEEADWLVDTLDVVTSYAGRRMTQVLKPPLAVPATENRRVRAALRALNGWAEREIAAAGNGDQASFLKTLIDRGVRDRILLRDEALTILMAGHETVAATMSWALIHVALEPELQSRLRQEAVAVSDRLHLPETARDLPLTRAVIEEVLRLHPPVWMIPRRTRREVILETLRVPAGADFLIPVWALQRNRDCWTDPDLFKPSRFQDPDERRKAAVAYMPFGAGPRTCIGRKPGIAESVAALARILASREISAERPDRLRAVAEDMAVRAGLTLLPAADAAIRMVPRHLSAGGRSRGGRGG